MILFGQTLVKIPAPWGIWVRDRIWEYIISWSCFFPCVWWLKNHYWCSKHMWKPYFSGSFYLGTASQPWQVPDSWIVPRWTMDMNHLDWVGWCPNWPADDLMDMFMRFIDDWMTLRLISWTCSWDLMEFCQRIFKLINAWQFHAFKDYLSDEWRMVVHWSLCAVLPSSKPT